MKDLSVNENLRPELSPEQKKKLRDVATVIANFLKNDEGGYWLSSRDRVNGIDDALATVKNGLTACESLRFRISEQQLTVNGMLLPPENAAIPLKDALMKRDVGDFIVVRKGTGMRMMVAEKKKTKLSNQSSLKR